MHSSKTITGDRRISSAGIALAATLTIGLALRWFVAVTLPNMLWPDEIWQTMEQGHRLVFGYGLVPWEYIDGIRSWILPAALGALMWVSRGLAAGSSGYIAVVQTVLCLIAILPIFVAFRWSQSRGARLFAATCAALVAAFWFELVYFAPKALTEVIAGNLLPVAIWLGARDSAPSRRRLIMAGLLFGFVFGLRMHLGPAVGLCVLWCAKTRVRERWIPLLIGLSGALICFGVVDWVTWGSPFYSFWRNVWINVVEKKSHGWGTAPPSFYLFRFAQVWGAGGIVLLTLALIGARRSALFLAAATTIVVTHAFIAHKEYRFVYPAIPLTIIAAGQGVVVLHDAVRRLRRIPRWTASLLAVGTTALICGASIFYAIHFDSAATANNFPAPRESHWTRFSGQFRAFSALSKQSDVCGVGLFHIHPYAVSGYAYLHKRVPLVLLRRRSDLFRTSSIANYMLGPSNEPLSPNSNYKKLTCWNTVCVYRRAGPCSIPPKWPNKRFWYIEP